jgi:uncharacterized ubiquitin-like protein YukD
MKITIKTLQGKPVEVEIDEKDTVADLKKKIEEKLNVEPASQKLIHFGKVLNDDNKKLIDYSIKNGEFLVLMTVKVLLHTHL